MAIERKVTYTTLGKSYTSYRDADAAAFKHANATNKPVIIKESGSVKSGATGHKWEEEHIVKPSRQSNGIFSQSSESAAMELARDFHGRDNKGVKEYTLTSYYPKDLAELGILIELQVFADDDNGEYIPINFAPEHPDLTDDETNVVLAAKDKQLYFIGGDQEYDIEEFAEAAGFDWPDEALEKDEVVLGQVKAIAYFADKHHLEGPKEQKTGIPYQHEFAVNEETGEQIGEYPTLVYCQKDKVFKLVGGSYEILPEGISG